MRLGLMAAIAVIAMSWGTAVVRAAEPAAGTISPTAPTTDWLGTVEGPHTTAVDVAQGYAGGTHGTCVEPSCDVFRLTVEGNFGSRPLVLDAAATTAADNLMLEVVLPDGSTSFQGGTLTDYGSVRRLTVPAAPDGVYLVRIGGDARLSPNFVMTYEASAALGDLGPSGCRASRVFQYDSAGPPLTGGPTNDPLYPKAFGHPQMRVPAAWAQGGRGAGVVIAILDTGVDHNHPDLRDNLVPGADLVEGLEGDCAAGPADTLGHGTLVAGLAAAEAGNGTGIAGVAPEAKIMPIRVCSTRGCSNQAIASGIRWAVDHGAGVINLSLGADERTQLLDLQVPGQNLDHLADDVAYAVDRGAVVVSVAGNSSWALCAHPGADPGALCVAAVDKRGHPTSYSNLPSDRDGEVDAFRAFGGGGVTTPLTACDELAISTAWPGTLYGSCGRAYQASAGTSFAAPHVAGAAAILAGLGLDNDEIVERLKATASNDGSYDPVMGYGIPDLAVATAGLGSG